MEKDVIRDELIVLEKELSNLEKTFTEKIEGEIRTSWNAEEGNRFLDGFHQCTIKAQKIQEEIRQFTKDWDTALKGSEKDGQKN